MSIKTGMLLNLIKPDFICCEIGVWKGGYSKLISSKKFKHLYLIDPWVFVPSRTETWYGGLKAKNSNDMEKIYQSVKHRYEKNKNVTVIRKDSSEALRCIPNLDWSYIDGDHSYDHVMTDIQQCYAITNKGGFVCGDDMQKPPVSKALHDFVEINKISNVTVKGHQFILEKQ